MEYYITFGAYSKAVSGSEAAYDLFRKACDLAECFGETVALCDAETGEVIADNLEED